MEFYRIVNSIKKKDWFGNIPFSKSATSIHPATKEDENYLSDKNVLLSGEFFPMSKIAFKENLLKREVNVQPEISPETEILICGKYPDWCLVEEARLYGIKIIFVDKAGEIFSRMATKLYNNRSVLSVEEHLGV